MSTEKLDEKTIVEFLNRGVDRAGESGGDPLTPTNIKVSLDQLQPYDLNPRQSRNPKYEEIRESIESVGLKFPFRITRRHPDDEKYSVRDGGNTRLAILNELHDKYLALAEQPDISEDEKLGFLTKADSFYMVPCKFVPFVDDIDALSNHMIENEARCGTKFIERALVVARYRKLFEDAGFTNLSGRQLAKKISEHGWRVGQDHITRYDYATTLLDYIPTAFWEGAGGPLVRKLRALYRACQNYWVATDYGKTQPGKIDELFYETLAEYDDVMIDVDGFSQSMFSVLESKVGVSSLTINSEINALLRDSNHKVIATGPAATTADYSTDPYANENNNNTGTAVATQPATHKDDTGGTSGTSSLTATGNQNTQNTQNTQNSSYREPANPSPAEQRTRGDINIDNTNSNISDTDQTVKTKPIGIDDILAVKPNPARINLSSDELVASLRFIKNDILPDANDLGSLHTALLEQALSIETMVKGDLGLKILEDEAFFLRGIFFDVTDFKNTTPPIYGNPDDDLRVAVWWQLYKISYMYMATPLPFIQTFSGILESYIRAISQHGYDSHDLFMWMEFSIIQHPHIYQACERLHRILELIMLKLEAQGASS